MNNIPMLFIKPDRRPLTGTIVKKRDNGELYFLPATIRKKKTKKWYIILFALLILHVMNYASLYTVFKNQQNYLSSYVLLSILISVSGIVLYIKTNYNYNNIENDLIYIGKDTESLKTYFDGLFVHDKVKFFYYIRLFNGRDPIRKATHIDDVYIRKAIYINDKSVSNIFGTFDSKLEFYFIEFILITFFLIPTIVLIQQDYTLVRSSFIFGLFFLPMVLGYICFMFFQILMSFKGRLSQQIELINFLVYKYGKKENEK